MNYFLVGIGGIGMSALAQLLKARGGNVEGSDRDPSPTTDLLEERGVTVTFGHKEIPPHTDVLVYSDAVPTDNPERASAVARGVPQYSYFEMLGQVSSGMRTIAVAGTHGKTTVTGMLTKILVDSGKTPTAVIGSIVRDFGSNFVSGDNGLFVVEACEYKNHLLNLSPEILVITNLELDHTDFFKSLEDLQDTFKQAIERVPAHGYVVTDTRSDTIAPLLHYAKATVVDYNTGERIKNIEYRIDNIHSETLLELQLPGEFNQANARAALCAAQVAFQDLAEPTRSYLARKALADFKGSWRRFEFKGELPNGTLVYDDYAHHPTAVRKTIEAAREKFTEHGVAKKIVVAFHPHLYSRTRRFLDEFAAALATADEVILAPIYAAREPHDEAISSEILAQKISALGTSAVAYASLEEVREFLTSHVSRLTSGSTVLITMGAGDIYKVAEQLVHE